MARGRVRTPSERSRAPQALREDPLGAAWHRGVLVSAVLSGDSLRFREEQEFEVLAFGAGSVDRSGALQSASVGGREKVEALAV